MDYRTVNSSTVPTFWRIPNTETELSDVRGVNVLLELISAVAIGSYQLYPYSQPLFAFMTPSGVVMLTRTPQGGCKAAQNLLEKVEPCFANLADILKAWLDDFMLYAKNEDQMIHILRRFIEICRSRRSGYIAFEIRLLSSRGILDCNYPRTAAEICEYVHGLNWISSRIPRFAERVAPVRDILEIAHTKASVSRKKKSIVKFGISSL
eukprot:IDg4717t1